MRPLHLTIRGIGPFATEEKIPFEQLGQGGLYLITGDTGAGKTTIFDAICFALFGEVSGEVRESTTLRSDYAKATQESQVEFRFVQQGQEYLVVRNPAYERPKLRGTGMVKQQAGAQLTLPDGSVVDGEREVTRRIEEILGLDRNQFKQMAMIAQGEFLKLLLADTKKRSEIFRKIFGTGLYSSLQERLRLEAAQWKKKCEETERSIRQYLEEIQLEPEGQETCQQTKILRKWIAEAGLDEAQQIPLQLEEWLKQKRQELTALEQEAEAQEILSQTVTEALTRVEQENRQRNQWMLEQQRYEAHKQQEESRRQEELFLERVDRVEALCRPLQMEWQKARMTLSRQTALWEEKCLRKERLAQKLPELRKAKEESLRTEEQRQTQRAGIAVRKAELPGRKALLSQVKQLQQQKKTAQEQLAGLETSYFQWEATYRQRSTVYMEWQQQFLRQQAGVLASRLEKGQPCPVCGSMEHPSPANHQGQLVEESQVQQAQDAMQKAQEKLRQLGGQLQSKRTLVEQLTSQRDGMMGQLEGWDEHRLQAEEKALEQEEHQLRLWEKQAQQAIKDYDICQKELLPLEGELENQAVQVEQAKHTLATAKDAWLEGLKQEQLTEAQYEKYLLPESEKKRRRAECQRYREAGVRFLANLDTLQTLVEESRKLRQERGYERLLQIREEGHDEDSGKEIKTDEPMFSQQLEQALKEKSNQLTQMRAQAERVRSTLRQRVAINEKLLGQLKKQMETRRQQMSQWELYADLDRTAGGNLKGQERLALEQYVQAFYFDQIVERANGRFHEMSGGRYQLGRRQEASNRRSMAGLELEVMDYYTGKCRPVASLSGGEAFQASLSLALGMSDVVQSAAGGIRVEAMFVDEGFGSLDKEAMDLAIDTLKGLSEENFLVGIISHVEELKERIEQKILVEKGSDGSHIRLV